jgi:hypothetical protein
MNLVQIERHAAAHRDIPFAVEFGGGVISASLQTITTTRQPGANNEARLSFIATFETDDNGKLLTFDRGVGAVKGTYLQYEKLVAERERLTVEKKAEEERIVALQRRVAEGLAKLAGVTLAERGSYGSAEYGVRISYGEIEIKQSAYEAFAKALDELDLVVIPDAPDEELVNG